MRVEARLPWTKAGTNHLDSSRDKTLEAKLVQRHLKAIQWGQIVLVEDQETTKFGDSSASVACHLQVNNPAVYTKILSSGAVGAAEAYMDGDWTTDNLTMFIRVMLRNRDVLNQIQGELKLLKSVALKLFHLRNRDSIGGSKRNIAAHYDLGNDFFKNFLDPTMSYSSGIFNKPSDSLEDASRNKNDALCRKLDLTPTDNLLEIGTGWGEFAVHAAQQYGCHVTTTTISEEQHAYAKARVAELGLEDRITLLKQDYRLLTGTYDKLVSVEMIEAVGIKYLPLFFQQCSKLLKPEGQMILQAITIADQQFEATSKSVDFIQRYIFPGGALPSITRLSAAACENSDLRFLQLEDITEHYSETLRHWSKRFQENIETIRALDFGEQFIRMWEYYFAYCEGGFTERAIGCVHLQLHKPGFRRAKVAQ